MNDDQYRDDLELEDDQSWADCLIEAALRYDVDPQEVLTTYEHRRFSGKTNAQAAKDAAWAHGLTD